MVKRLKIAIVGHSGNIKELIKEMDSVEVVDVAELDIDLHGSYHFNEPVPEQGEENESRTKGFRKQHTLYGSRKYRQNNIRRRS